MIKEQNEAKEYQKVFFRSVIQIVEFDRERIAKDLHDEVGTILSIIKLNLSKISRNIDDKAQTQKLLSESIVLLESTIERTRSISMDLMPATLTKLGYEKGLMELGRQISASNQIKVNVQSCADELRLLSVIELELYRVMQEVLNNIIKHAKATEINIIIQSDEKGVLTQVQHNGIGINSENIQAILRTGKGMGLRSIQKRLELIDASIEYEISVNKESLISINVPAYEQAN